MSPLPWDTKMIDCVLCTLSELACCLRERRGSCSPDSSSQFTPFWQLLHPSGSCLEEEGGGGEIRRYSTRVHLQLLVDFLEHKRVTPTPTPRPETEQWPAGYECPACRLRAMHGVLAVEQDGTTLSCESWAAPVNAPHPCLTGGPETLPARLQACTTLRDPQQTAGLPKKNSLNTQPKQIPCTSRPHPLSSALATQTAAGHRRSPTRSTQPHVPQLPPPQPTAPTFHR
jgi:hypothetical protein